MISTQYIKSVSIQPEIPKSYSDYEVINVLKWNNSKWKTLCPYYLKTDGNEIVKNPGNILFENFYQSLKIYDKVYENEVYSSKYQMNNPKYLWWKYEPINKYGDTILHKDSTLNYNLYFRWRDSLWACKNPIRYPNKVFRTKYTRFVLCIDKDGNESRLDYITTRKEIYVKEYIRLIKQLPEYKLLLDKLKNGKKLLICEIDVPALNKYGEYGKDCNEHNICDMSLEKLELLLNDTNEAFGHGLCLAYSLLKDLKSN